ncbi:hypothetical protein F3Y22_tig00111273pilonHSYRG00325 [Hibiscus syriacus]|uniref:ABC-2 type transporter transmembrane domain-containing protein n=1 Tax=Hibiscus syriacus TaxID=106335 RepID=A0A6A2YSE1_HIBSY|nr:hypothetical protein F3Y22_tig00111273pilonHSYRG00325 [Hibiscus syriacus]
MPGLVVWKLPMGMPHVIQKMVQDSRDHLPSLMASCYPITIKFIDVCFKVKGSTSRIEEKTILNNITGMVSPGEMLATSFFRQRQIYSPQCLGREAQHGHGNFSGTMLANNRKPTKQIAKRTGFVTQDDVLYPHLTVRETLVFCSLLRLPKTLSAKDKISVAERFLFELGLSKCENTIIGNSFIRGFRVENGKDGASVGFDFGFVGSKGEDIVTSMHQPLAEFISRLISVGLDEGRSLYFGKGSEAMGYFESIGFSPSFPMNPADFLLDLANGVCKLDGVSERERPNVKQTLSASYNTLLAPKVKAACMEANLFQEKIRSSVPSKAGLATDLISLLGSISLAFSFKEALKKESKSLSTPSECSNIFVSSRTCHLHERARFGHVHFIFLFHGTDDGRPLDGTHSPLSFPSRNILDGRIETQLGRISTDIVGSSRLRARLSGLGLALGALIMDAKQASTIVTVTMLAFVLTGGYYVHKVPSCMAWIKYTSTTYYSYKLFINVQYGDGKKVSSMLGCSHPGSDTVSCKFINRDIAGQIRPELSVGVLSLMFVGYRLLAYLALRRIKG